MPLLSQHQSNEYTKMMVLGDPGSGKTGGLTSLVEADYWLGILDYDNGLDSLKQFIRHKCPSKENNVEYVTLRDRYKAGPEGPVIVGQATAFANGLKLLDKWTDGSNPAEWGSNKILVIDSLTMMAKAAFDWREQMVAGQGKKYDQRAVYYDTQKVTEKTLGNLASEYFRTNVIVITHISYSEDGETGIRKGYPKSIGSALDTWIGAYFNSLALVQTGQGGKRVIRTTSTPAIELKNPRPFAMAPQYPIDTGLADFFAVLREQPKERREPTQSRPQLVNKPTVRRA